MKIKSIKIKTVFVIATLIAGGILIFAFNSKSDVYNLPEKVSFNYDIRPILSDHCFVCHGPDSSTRKANLRLDIRVGATSKSKSRTAAIVPRFPNRSGLIKRITSSDPSYQMPPPETQKALSGRQIALLKKWIKQGAKWETYWAFNPPKNPKLPGDMNDESPSTIINYLVNKKLEQQEITPAPLATKNELIRRVSFLITGLPPSIQDLDSFLLDDTSNAFEQIVDKYLESPQYGERWARHWMDLVRYGEHMGHEFDIPISGAWQYRDYLIRAFNKDVPYDIFVKEHLAGDLLDQPRVNQQEGYNESVIGTAYSFLGEGKHSPVNLKGEERDRIDNIIDVTSKTFQALTVSCARCHDHKFDPIPTTDYYAMYGMIESARIGPIGARVSMTSKAQMERLQTIEEEMRQAIEGGLSNQKNRDKNIRDQKKYISDQQESNNQLIGDFGKENWDGWYTNGRAFGPGPILNKPIFHQDQKQLKSISSGYASSKYFTSGVQGVLHSPNFIIKEDTIAVRARGKNGTIRIVVDNFQIIQNPLWGSFEKIVDDYNWTDYKLDVSMVKGHKAYISFMPGKYNRHNFETSPEDYIEVQYSFMYSGQFPKIEGIVNEEKVIYASISDQVNIEKRIVKLKTEYDGIASSLRDTTHFIGLMDGDAVYSPVFVRGEIDQLSKEKTPHGFLSAINLELDSFPQAGSGRLAWAEALVDPSNPLTSRVMVNRIWHHLFGRGIVETVDNFGIQGKLPTHPELLDYLAIHFIEQGWSIKKLIKDILLSEVFQQSTKGQVEGQIKDPNNEWLHHYPIRRIEAEAIRDGMLAVSGEYNSTMYGPPVPIHLTPFMTGRGRPGTSGPLDGDGRRSIYTAVRRNFLSPLMTTFDTPMPFSTFGRRNTTNVPAQSLAILNDPFVHEQSEKWANRLFESDMTSENRIKTIYRSAFARSVSDDEMRKAIEFLNEIALNEKHSKDQNVWESDVSVWKEYCHTIFNLKEFIYLL